MHRAARWLLDLPDRRPPQEDEGAPIDTVVVELAANAELAARLSVLGRWHGGSLFGMLEDTTLRVLHAAALGPPGWPGQPLTPSLPYLLGLSEAAGSLISPAVDWRGQWLAAPDGRLPERGEDLVWLTLGARRGLFDAHHALLVLGVQEGYLDGRAYIWDEGEPVEVACPLRPPHRE